MTTMSISLRSTKFGKAKTWVIKLTGTSGGETICRADPSVEVSPSNGAVQAPEAVNRQVAI